MFYLLRQVFEKKKLLALKPEICKPYCSVGLFQTVK